MGRKAIKIDKQQFEDLLELQCTKEDISGFFHCSNDTIERFCRKTYGDTFLHISEDYRSIGRVSIRRSQFAMAKTNPQMAIHLGKQYLGQTDKTETKVTADLNVKHGTITRIVYYDPETQKPTEEKINGREDDVEAFLKDPEGYNGDSMAFMLPNKDPDPDDQDGIKTSRINVVQTVTAPNGEKVISEFPDDGRGGYTGDPQTDLIIENAIDENRRVRFEWASNKRGGYLPRNSEG